MKQTEYLNILLKCDALRFTDSFFYTQSGEIKPFRIEAPALHKNLDEYNSILEQAAKKINEKFPQIDIVSGVNLITDGIESISWSSLNLAQMLNVKSHMTITQDNVIRGIREIEGKNILLMEDILGTGYTLENICMPLIKEYGGNILGAYSLIDKMERENPIQNLECDSLIKLDNFAWDYLKNKIPKEHEETINEWQENRFAWAKNKLTSNQGIEKLIELALDTPTKPISLKIKTFYSSIKKDLGEARKNYNLKEEQEESNYSNYH